MQIFHGTVRLTSKPTSDGNLTTAQAEVMSHNDKECATPITLKAYGKAAARLEALAAGDRIQVIQGTLHRGENYSYVIKPYAFIILPKDLVMPDWNVVILAGRTTKDIDTNNRREVINNGEFLSVTRAIAVNRSKTEADFFDIHALGGVGDKVNRAMQLLEHFGNKGAFVMVEGRLTSSALRKDDGSVTIFTKVRAERLFYGPRVSVAQPQGMAVGQPAPSAAQAQYSAPSAPVQTVPTTPTTTTPSDLPF